MNDHTELSHIIFDQLERFSRLFSDHPYKARRCSPNASETAFVLLLRIYRTLKASCVLASANSGYEQMILLRSIIEAYVGLAWLLDDECELRARCYGLHGVIQQGKAGQKVLEADESEEHLSRWQSARQEFESICGNPNSTHWSGNSIERLCQLLDERLPAESKDFQHLYNQVIRLTSSYSHAGSWTNFGYEREGSKKELLDGVPPNNPVYLEL